MRVGILGAGAIGGYLAVELSAAGVAVTLVGRSRSLPSREDLVAVPLEGGELRPRDDLVISDELSALAPVEVCLVAVKSRDTGQAGEQLAETLAPDSVIVSMQNGLRNVARLRDALRPSRGEGVAQRVLGGMVSYNVFRDAEGYRRQATSGLLVIEQTPQAYSRLAALRRAFAHAGDKLELRADIDEVLAGKLLLNLNNGICAATGLGVAASLRDADARWCFAQCILEGLDCMKAAGIEPARVAPLPASIIARSLMLPDFLVMTLARSLVSVTPEARSSTLQDLDRGRETEIDELNGAIPWLARRAGRPAPCNELVTKVVHEHEARVLRGETADFLPPSELRRRMRDAQT